MHCIGSNADAEAFRQSEQGLARALRPVGYEGDGEGLVQLVDRVVDQHLGVVQHDDPAGQALDVREIVRRKHDCGAGVAQGLDGGLEELPAGEGIESTGGLVEEQQLGSVAHRAKQRNLSCLAF